MGESRPPAGRPDANKRPLTDRKPSQQRCAWGVGTGAAGLAEFAAELGTPECDRYARCCYKWANRARLAGRAGASERRRGPIRKCGTALRAGAGGPARSLASDIEPHSFQFLTGPSGAGKTSLLRLLFLSMRPTRGLITLFGQDIATLSKDALATLRRRIGIVFQDFRLLDHMTTYENVALPLRVIGQDEDSFRDEVVELLHWVGLGDRM